MKYNKLYDYYHKIINIFSRKRMRVSFYVAVVLWVAVAAQIIINRVFHEQAQITEAFIKSDAQEMESELEILAEYKSDNLKESDKKALIKRIADSIGLTLEGEIIFWEDENRKEYLYYKQAKQASTEIKVVSITKKEDKVVTTKNYIIIRLKLLQGIQSIDGYKTILENTISDIGIVNKQITLKYEGNKEGDLTSIQKHELASDLVDELQGKVALEYDEGDLYTAYAYTGRLKEYVTSMGNKINVQIVITYNELTNKTHIALATPINNESW